MRVLGMDECDRVGGAAACAYADMDTMMNISGSFGAVAGAAGFLWGGPVVGGIAGAGVAASALMAMGVYTFYILGYDLLGGCVGYTGQC